MDFEEALRPLWPDLVRYSRALAGSSDRGDDLLQESLLRAWRGYEKLNDPDSFKSWLLKIISNTHKSRTRVGWVKQLVGLEAAANEPTVPELAYEEKELIRLALNKLPFEQRQALILYEVLSMTVTEVAAITKVTESAVKSRLARGREKLRRYYCKLQAIPDVTRPLFKQATNRGEEL